MLTSGTYGPEELHRAVVQQHLALPAEVPGHVEDQRAQRLHLGAPVALEGQEGERARASPRRTARPAPAAVTAAAAQQRAGAAPRGAPSSSSTGHTFSSAPKAASAPSSARMPGAREQRGHGDGGDHHVVAGVRGRAEQRHARHPHPGAAQRPGPGAGPAYSSSAERPGVGERRPGRRTPRRSPRKGSSAGERIASAAAGGYCQVTSSSGKVPVRQDLVPALVDHRDVAGDVRAREDDTLKTNSSSSSPGHGPGDQPATRSTCRLAAACAPRPSPRREPLSRRILCAAITRRSAAPMPSSACRDGP